jgi:mannose-1-phosphate guanylyltransferase
MRAMVLCAGLGTRMRPLTTLWPKPALPLLGRPLLRYAFSSLQQVGVTEVGINTHHLPEVMQAVAEREAARAGLSLTVVHEAGELQGTGGGVRGLKDFLSRGPSLVINGDVLFAVDLAPIIEAHHLSGADATMVLLPMPAGETFNPVELDEGQMVRRIAGLGPGADRLTPWHFTGVHVISPRVFDFMAPQGPLDINRDVYVAMMNAGCTLRGHVVSDPDVYWSDLGTPPRYAQAHRDLLFGQVPLVRFGAASPLAGMLRHGLSAWAHPTARLGDARISGPAWFGEGAVLGRDVRIGALVSIGAGAKVGDGALLNRVAVLDGAEVEGGRLYEDVILAPRGVRVPFTG